VQYNYDDVMEPELSSQCSGWIAASTNGESGFKLSPHFHLVQKLRMHGAIPPLSHIFLSAVF
jgi:hypothetical protein